MQLMKMDMASLAGGGNTSTPPRASSNQRVQVLNMDNFIDTTNIEGRFEFSEFVRAYGKYLDEQLEVYNGIQWYQVSHWSAQAQMHKSYQADEEPVRLLQVPCTAHQRETQPQEQQRTPRHCAGSARQELLAERDSGTRQRWLCRNRSMLASSLGCAL